MRDVVTSPTGTSPTSGGSPSGAQWTITSGGHVAVLVEVGGGVRTYEVDGRPVLAGYAADEMAPGAAGQVLVPWPNRIRDGRYSFNGSTYQLPLTEPETHSAAHGLARWSPWQRVDGAADSVTLECFLPAQPGYSWPLRLRTTWTVGPDGLRARHEATNLGGAPAPFGLGAHPYLTVADRTADELTLAVPARTRLLVDGRKLPIGAAKVAGRAYDYTRPRRLAGVHLDTAFGDLIRDADGRSTVYLRDASNVPGDGTGTDGVPAGPGVAIWADANFRWWQLYTADGLPPDRARRSVAVEPMTCPPDAFRSQRDVLVLEPGQTWSATWGVGPVPAGHPSGA